MLPLSLDMNSAAHTFNVRAEQSKQSCKATGVAANRVQMKSYPAIWRPWILTHKELGLRQKGSSASGMESFNTQMSKGGLGFQHPVRLCMPKSRTQEYLSHLGKKVLASFPVQATLHFYNDDSTSEEEEAEE